LNTSFYDRKRTDFSRRYLRIYPLLRFWKWVISFFVKLQKKL
jgi:hypothetical protein